MTKQEKQGLIPVAAKNCQVYGLFTQQDTYNVAQVVGLGGGGLKLGAILTSAILVLGYLINIVLLLVLRERVMSHDIVRLGDTMSLPAHRVGVSSSLSSW